MSVGPHCELEGRSEIGRLNMIRWVLRGEGRGGEGEVITGSAPPYRVSHEVSTFATDHHLPAYDGSREPSISLDGSNRISA